MLHETQPAAGDIPAAIRYLDIPAICVFTNHDHLIPASHVVRCRHCGHDGGACLRHTEYMRSLANRRVMCLTCRHQGPFGLIFEIIEAPA